MAPFPDIGSRIAGYVVEGVLGRGGMGIVFRARHQVLDREAAVKVLLDELGMDSDFRARFLRESRLAARLGGHPNVLTVYDAGDSEGHLYLAMYLVQGPSLADVIATEGRLAPERALEIVAQVASALDAAHGQGLVHRDVKPANVLLEVSSGGADHCFLGDFGLVKETGSSTRLTDTNATVGTLDYMAPEQLDPRLLRGESLDGKVDVYALGCVFYECLTGAKPFADVENATALAVAHFSRPPPRVTDARPALPPAIDVVVARAMAKDRADRHPSAGRLVEDAARALSGPPGAALTSQSPAPADDTTRVVVGTIATHGPATVAAPPPVRPSTSPRHQERGRRRLLLIGVPLLAAAIGGAVLLAVDGGADPPASVWTAGGGLLVEYDPETGDELRRTTIGQDAVAVAVDSSSVWVANAGDGTVSHLDRTTNRVVGIQVGGDPAGIASDGSFAWVAIRGQGVVAQIDPDTDEVVKRIPVGEHPQGMTADDAAVWVANFDGESVSRIDPRTASVVEAIPVGSLPTTVALGLGSAWVPEQGDSTVTRIDPARNTTAESIGAGPEPIDVAIEGSSLWIVDEIDNRRLIQVSADTGQPLRAVVGFGDLLHVTFADGVLWVVDVGRDDVAAVDPRTGRILRKLTPPEEPRAVAVG